MPRRALPPEQRFWPKVSIRSESECWPWLGPKAAHGYGAFWGGPERRRQVSAHRFMWELKHGPIPEGLIICHTCDNPVCVNPSHLFIGTHKDNTDDMKRKGRNPSGYRTLSEKARAIVVLAEGGFNRVAITRVLNVSTTAVDNILGGAKPFVPLADRQVSM